MTKEEKVIKRLKRRTARIILYSITLAGLLLISGSYCLEIDTLDRIVTPAWIAIGSFQDLNSEFPSLFAKFRAHVEHRTELIPRTMLSLILAGCVLFELVSEVIGNTKNEVIVSMWERIQKLEKEAAGC